MVCFTTFWLLLPATAATGFFSEYIDKYLNKEVDPCDDFYEHVCPIAIKKKHLLEEDATARYSSFIEQMTSPRIQEFRLRVESNVKTFSDVPMEPEDSEALLQLVGPEHDECMESNENITDLMFLYGIERYDAHFRLQSSPYYSALKKKMMDIFLVLKNILIKEFSEALWTKRHPELVNFLNTVEMAHFENSNYELEKEIDDIKNRYEQCIGITTNSTRYLAEACINYAACPTKLRQTPFTFHTVKEEMKFFQIIQFYKYRAFQYNAGYTQEDGNFLYLSPVLYTLEEDDLPFMLGSLDFAMSHELGHVFFNGQVAPSNSECFRKHMQGTCNTFLGERECTKYNENADNQTAINGNYSRLVDDGADWVGMHASLKALEHYIPMATSITPESDVDSDGSTGILRKYFYANAINLCTPSPTMADKHHSAHWVRVNGIASMFPEFSKAFGCKRGSNMAKAATCLPFAGIGAPTRKRSGH